MYATVVKEILDKSLTGDKIYTGGINYVDLLVADELVVPHSGFSGTGRIDGNSFTIGSDIKIGWVGALGGDFTKLGINMAATYPLDVNGTIRCNSNMFVGNYLSTVAHIIAGTDMSVTQALDVGTTSILMGNVGIGQTPGSNKLEVNGNSVFHSIWPLSTNYYCGLSTARWKNVYTLALDVLNNATIAGKLAIGTAPGTEWLIVNGSTKCKNIFPDTPTTFNCGLSTARWNYVWSKYINITNDIAFEAVDVPATTLVGKMNANKHYTLDDNTAIWFTPTSANGVLIVYITTDGETTSGEGLFIYHATGSNPRMVLSSGYGVNGYGNALTGTTGADNAINLGADNTGKVYLENRRGITLDFSIVLLGD